MTMRSTAATFPSARRSRRGGASSDHGLAGEIGHRSLSFQARVSTGLFGHAPRPIDAANRLAVLCGVGRHIDEVCVAFFSRQDRLGQQAKAANDMEWRLIFFPFDAGIFDPEARLTPAAPMRHPFGVEKLEPDIERAHRPIVADVAHELVLQEIRSALKRL